MAAGSVLIASLTFLLLVCLSHSYVIQGSGYTQGSDPDSGSGAFGPEASVLPGGSGLGLQGLSYGAKEAPASSPYSSVLVSYHPAGPAVPNVEPAVANEPSWEVPQSLEAPSSGGSAATSFVPEDPSAGFFGPFVPEFTPGELSHVENSFEHGSNDHESESQGELQRGPYAFPQDGSLPAGSFGELGGPDGLSVAHFPGPPGFPGHYWFPDYDWMFLTGQYPAGTVSHFSSSFEQGQDDWQDSHYDKYYHSVPTGPVTPTFPKPVQQVKDQAQ